MKSPFNTCLSEERRICRTATTTEDPSYSEGLITHVELHMLMNELRHLLLYARHHGTCACTLSLCQMMTRQSMPPGSAEKVMICEGV